MILDTSAVLAILFEEPGYDLLLRKLTTASARRIGAPTVAEANLVLAGRLGSRSLELLTGFLQTFDVTVTAFSEAHWHAAAQAAIRFGRGRHAAALNFGDCLTYAVAKVAEEPLLFVGNDFVQTDLPAA